MREVAVIGVGMTPFGKFLGKGLKALAREAVEEALADAGLGTERIEAAYVGNAAAGVMTGQHMIRGQVVLDPLGINKVPVFNIENACASGSFAFNLAVTAVAAGVHDCALVLGFEKLHHPDKTKTFLALESAVDVEDYLEHFRRVEESLGTGEKVFDASAAGRSRLLDVYAFHTRRYMERYGLTREHFAAIAVKAHRNGAANPRAQYRQEVTAGEVLGSGDVVFPFTRMMCAPISDGGSAAIVCSASLAARFTSRPIRVSASVVGSGQVSCDLEDTITRRTAARLYETAAIGPEDIDIVEVHDTTSSAEVIYLVELGLCPGERAAERIESGWFDLGGRLPVNPSGGLTTKGHPVGATGLAQIYEIVHQLRGTAGVRQASAPKVGLTHNGGGILGVDAGAMALHVFHR